MPRSQGYPAKKETAPDGNRLYMRQHLRYLSPKIVLCHRCLTFGDAVAVPIQLTQPDVPTFHKKAITKITIKSGVVWQLATWQFVWWE